MSVETDQLGRVPTIEAGGAALQRLTQRRPDLSVLAERLHRDGYAIHDFGFPDHALDDAARFTFNTRPKHGRIQDGWQFNTGVQALAAYPAVLDVLSELYGRRAIPFQTLNFKYGSEQATHSDAIHFDSRPDRFMCGIWIALEDIHPDAGPLHYYKNSHHLSLLGMAEAAPSGTYEDYEAYVAKAMEDHGLERQSVLLKRGEALIWTANLFHGGDARRDPKQTRLSQVNHYYFEDCAYFTPRAGDLKSGKPFVREPFDIARQQFVQSSRTHLQAGPTLRYRFAIRVLRLAARLGLLRP